LKCLITQKCKLTSFSFFVITVLDFAAIAVPSSRPDYLKPPNKRIKTTWKQVQVRQWRYQTRLCPKPIFECEWFGTETDKNFRKSEANVWTMTTEKAWDDMSKLIHRFIQMPDAGKPCLTFENHVGNNSYLLLFFLFLSYHVSLGTIFSIIQNPFDKK
jgi:hypothetical protein